MLLCYLNSYNIGEVLCFISDLLSIYLYRIKALNGMWTASTKNIEFINYFGNLLRKILVLIIIFRFFFAMVNQWFMLADIN